MDMRPMRLFLRCSFTRSLAGVFVDRDMVMHVCVRSGDVLATLMECDALASRT